MNGFERVTVGREGITEPSCEVISSAAPRRRCHNAFLDFVNVAYPGCCGFLASFTEHANWKTFSVANAENMPERRSVLK